MEFSPFIVRGALDLHAMLQSECHKRNLCEADLQISLQSRTLAIIKESTPIEPKAPESTPHQNPPPYAPESNADSSAESALLDERYFNTSGYTIQQTCELLVKPRESIESFQISLSDERDKAFLHCDDSFIALEDGAEDFCALVFAKLALLGVILRDLDALRARLQQIIAHIRTTPKAKAKPICILESTHFTPPKPMRFVFMPKVCYEQTHVNKPKILYANERLRQCGRVEEAFYGVKKGELVGVYEFGDCGVAGRNLLGEYICAQEKPREKIIPTNQPNISFKAYEDRIEYFSQIQGFIALNNQHTAPFAALCAPYFSGENAGSEQPDTAAPAHAMLENHGKNHAKGYDKSFDGADLFCFFTPPSGALKSTNTPPLLGGVEAHIALSVESSDSSVDALGDGVYIEAHSLEISGNLGSETTIKAKHLVLNGASHKSSQILAQSAKILTHKGLLIAQECVIKNLDSGFIYADSARIQEANASTIYAKSISLQRARNANACHFSHQLHIDEIPQKRGDDNMLVFDICANSAYRDYLAQARIYHAKKLDTLEQTRAWCKLLAPRFEQAQRFLYKMQGFTKPQREIALKEPSFKLLFTQSRATYKLYKTLLLRESSLTQALEKLERSARHLQSHLAHATIHIGHVGGFENYALLHSCSLTPSTPADPEQVRAHAMSHEEQLLLQVGKSAHIIIESIAHAPESSADSNASQSTPKLHLKAVE